MSKPLTARGQKEVAHGKFLAEGNAELIWGWESPAGRLRAARRADLIAVGARLGPGMSALEIGCGTGLFTKRFSEFGARIVAVDLSPDLLDFAQKRDLPGVEFKLKPFEDCDTDGPFDAIIASSVLHHLDLTTAWQSVFDLLKPGGRLSVAEPNMLNPQIYCERHFRFLYPSVSPDETAFVRFTVRRELEQVGFTDISIVPFDWLHPSTPTPLIPVVRGLGAVLERIWGVREFSGSLWITATRPR